MLKPKLGMRISVRPPERLKRLNNQPRQNQVRVMRAGADLGSIAVAAEWNNVGR